MSKTLSVVISTIAAGLVVFCVQPTVRADDWDKETIITFHEPVEVPGKALSPGKYIFKIADSSSRNIVQIFAEDGSQLIATIMAIPAYRREATDQTAIMFEERPSGNPEAIRKWFYPGDQFGLEFVYSGFSLPGAMGAANLPDPPELEPGTMDLEQEPLVIVVIPLPDPVSNATEDDAAQR